MTGDVLAPLLITFLVANVILLLRVWAKRRHGRRGGAAADRSPELQFAAEPAAPDPTSEAQAEDLPAPDPTGDVKAEELPAPDPTSELQAEELPAPDLAEVQLSHAEAGRDLLTGLDDEATWDRRVADETARVKRYPRPVTIVRMELDGLDRLIGLLGDEAGDRLLRAMADTLRRLARDTDHVARLGHGDFGVLMPETSEDAAIGYVDRVSRACELWLESGAVAVRLAIGWASSSGDVGLDDVQRLASERMRGGDWRDIRGAATVTGRDPAAREARRSPVAGVSFAADPRLEWERCRDPGCDHKRDHRRDRSR